MIQPKSNWRPPTDGDSDDDGGRRTNDLSRGNSSCWRSLAICDPYPLFAYKAVSLDSEIPKKSNKLKSKCLIKKNLYLNLYFIRLIGFHFQCSLHEFKIAMLAQPQKFLHFAIS